MNLKPIIIFVLLLFIYQQLKAQKETVVIVIKETGTLQPLAGATVESKKTKQNGVTNHEGIFEMALNNVKSLDIIVSMTGFSKLEKQYAVESLKDTLYVLLQTEEHELEQVVVSGSLKPIRKSESIIPVEIYTQSFLKANPVPNLFESMQNINGVKPQVNCSVCNTGDIHINGLEGPYTMVMIDGMPIVSGLSTVYGLSGIPQSLIDRVEVVKGPASTLYGSEAVGGIINVITKQPSAAPVIALDIMSTSWLEHNIDLGLKSKLGNNGTMLTGINYFDYSNPVDKNGDGFTDITLQKRLSVFNKLYWNLGKHSHLSVGTRYVYEDRWGGEMNWQRKYRGGDEVYGESIYTNRAELIANYKLPFRENIQWSFSGNIHRQNSVYGDQVFKADQDIAFTQMIWLKTIGTHDLLTGIAYRYTYYDDNTVVTADPDDKSKNNPQKTHLPGFFLQDEWSFHPQHKLLAGARYDHNSIHGNIFTPRIAYKWQSVDKHNQVRLSWGNGYRVANVFTEDHMALTGSREVVFEEDLKPEKSWNINLNLVKKIKLNASRLNIDASLFYTKFSNRIIADYESHPQYIYYANLNGHSISKGASLSLELNLPEGININTGVTVMDVYKVEAGEKSRQLFTEKWSGVWGISYTKPKYKIDYTGNFYGSMLLPLLNELDPRAAKSPFYSIQNIQVTYYINKKMEVYGGAKNLLNWLPTKQNPFLIARSFDPFNKQVEWGSDGLPLATAGNPYALQFDPTYSFAANQGIRAFLGFRFTLR